jgi:hypothetical protein
MIPLEANLIFPFEGSFTMRRTTPLGLLAAGALALAAGPVAGQGINERIDEVRQQRLQQQNERQQTVRGSPVRARLVQRIDEVSLDGVRARQALQWWSERTGVPLVVDWERLQNQGVSPDQPVDLQLRNVPAEQVLDLITMQMGRDMDLISQSTQWYVEIMTKRTANENPVLRVYDIREMLMEIPNFTDAPDFDMQSALESGRGGSGGGMGGGTGGGGSSSGGGLFGNDSQQDREKETLTKQESGQRIAQLIADTIEPDIWRANGGQYGTIRYHQGLLFVTAPQYVHDRIGMPTRQSRTWGRDRGPAMSVEAGGGPNGGGMGGPGPDQPQMERGRDANDRP